LGSGGTVAADPDDIGEKAISETISVEWSPPPFISDKGIIHAPATTVLMSAETCDTLILAIAKARAWVIELADGRATLANIAKREGKVKRHIRLLLPLAFVSPAIVKDIVDGGAPADLTVTGFAYALPYDWAEQAEKIGRKSAAQTRCYGTMQRSEAVFACTRRPEVDTSPAEHLTGFIKMGSDGRKDRTSSPQPYDGFDSRQRHSAGTDNKKAPSLNGLPLPPSPTRLAGAARYSIASLQTSDTSARMLLAQT
jgi:hypothetical protein